MANEKVKLIEEQILQDVPEILNKFKELLGDVFSLEVKLINSDDGKEVASWKEYIDGDMELRFPVKDALPNDQAFAFFSELVKEASDKRERALKILANILGIADKLML